MLFYQSLTLQSIFEYNGSAVIGMVGKDCVAVAADRRLGAQAQTVTMDFKKIYEMNDKLYVGFYGLATDAQTVLGYDNDHYNNSE